ncbi:hypothetical protein CEXT_126271 [Caerostris extrusa]|uniref:Uncharacterized protein n=1 Tax=Caerostris extrusa TaxID=172846 RepID=A0AAV4XGA9_CAEEX|nr:hypothetical protein CEXT_126271 [Caerostris extrusa]
MGAWENEKERFYHPHLLECNIRKFAFLHNKDLGGFFLSLAACARLQARIVVRRAPALGNLTLGARCQSPSGTGRWLQLYETRKFKNESIQILYYTSTSETSAVCHHQFICWLTHKMTSPS